jgi:putative DNA methylase
MRDEAENRIGHLYPKVEITKEMVQERPDLRKYAGQQLTVIAWLWARTVKSPNPAFAQVDVPLASTFMLSTKPGKEAYVEPVIEGGGYRFTVKVGKPKDAGVAKSGTKLARGANFQCLMSRTPIPGDYIKAEGKAGRLGSRLMAMVAAGGRGRVYLSPTEEHSAIARCRVPANVPTQDLPIDDTANFWCTLYGLTRFADLFTHRQLVALTTLSELVQDAREHIRSDAVAAGMPDDGTALDADGTGAAAYADAATVYLASAVSKVANIGSSIASWMSDRGAFRETFARQAIPMVWDFAEANPFADAGGSLGAALDKGAMTIDAFPASPSARAIQADAASQVVTADRVVSTDPPYYDNIGYADLSDFFYVWLRRSLKGVFPELFATLAVPKAEELVATPYRHGSKEKAEAFLLEGMTQAMHRLSEQGHPAFPVTIYYAFKQSESDDQAGTVSTGWDTFLAAVIRAGFAVTGTWPMRTEGSGRMVALGTNVLASSIVLVCRARPAEASTATRREFVTALKTELPVALAHLQRGNIAPVDLAQAAIGPGMAIYTRHSKVLDAAGNPLSVREALALINQTLDEALAEQEGDFDADTRWAVAWFEQSGFAEGEYGVAETLSKAKNTSVAGMVQAGILASSQGKVRLLRPDELPADWDPTTDPRLTAWEMVHNLVRALEAGGEGAAATLLAKLGGKAETARELCYRLYSLCERKKRAPEALSYNGLVQSWPEIARLAQGGGRRQPEQAGLFDEAQEA